MANSNGLSPMNDNPLTLHDIQIALIHKYQIPQGLNALKLFVFNIPNEDFTPKIPGKLQTWSALRKKSTSSKLFDFTVRMMNRRDVGTETEDPAYCTDTAPKTSFLIEDLLSADKRDIVGERVWGFVYDPLYSVEKVISEFLAENRSYVEFENGGNRTATPENADDEAMEDEDEGGGGRPRPKRGAKPPPKKKHPPTHPNNEFLGSLINSRTIATQLYLKYLSNNNKVDDLNMFPTIRNQIDLGNMVRNAVNLDEGKPLNIFNILKPEYAIQRAYGFAAGTNAICKEQCNLDNYFRMANGPPSNITFLDKFPLPEFITYIDPNYCNLENIKKLPIPKAFHMLFVENQTTIDDIVKKIEELRRYPIPEHDAIATKKAINDEISLLNAEMEELCLAQRELQTMFPESIKESIRNGNIGKGKGLDGRGSLSEENCKAEMRKTDIFWQHSLIAGEERAAIRKKHPRIHSRGFRDEMNKYYAKNCEIVWGYLQDTTIEEKPESVKCCVEYFQNLSVDKQWVENDMTFENLTNFGNLISRVATLVDKVMPKAIETNFQLFFLCHFANLTSHEFSFGLRPNILIAGPGGAGKSHLLDAVSDTGPPGGKMEFSHTTLNAFNVSKNFSGSTFVMHEAKTEHLGVDRYGKEMAADGPMKDGLTKGFRITLAYERDEETQKRTATIHASMLMFTSLWATNDILPSSETAMMTRFITAFAEKVDRHDRPKNSSSYRSDKINIPAIQEEQIHYLKLHSIYVVFWYKLIESGALPQLDFECPTLIAELVFKELQEKHKIKIPSQRIITMYQMLARAVHMYAAVDREFFSETGLHYRMRRDPVTGREIPRKLEAKDFLGLLKHGFVTQEESVFTLTMLESVIIPKFRNEVISAVVYNTCNLKNDVHAIPGNFQHFRKIVNEGPANDPNKYDSDYDYVSFSRSSPELLWNAVVKVIGGSSSANNVYMTIKEMIKEEVTIHPRKLVSIPVTDTNGRTVYVPTVIEDLTKKESRPMAIIDNDPHKQKGMKRLSILISAFTKMASNKSENILLDAIKKVLSYDTQLPISMITAIPYIRAVIAPTAHVQPVPAAPAALGQPVVQNIDLREYEDGYEQEERRVAVDLTVSNDTTSFEDMEEMRGTRFRQQHQQQQQQPPQEVVVVAQPLLVNNNAIVANTSSKPVFECFPSMMSIIEIKPVQSEKRFLNNPYALNTIDLSIIFCRVRSAFPSSVNSIERYNTTSRSIFDMSFDEYCYGQYCSTNGLNPMDPINKMALPLNHYEACFNERYNDLDRYEILNKRLIDCYPQRCLQLIDGIMDELKDDKAVFSTVSRIINSRDTEDDDGVEDNSDRLDNIAIDGLLTTTTTEEENAPPQQRITMQQKDDIILNTFYQRVKDKLPLLGLGEKSLLIKSNQFHNKNILRLAQQSKLLTTEIIPLFYPTNRDNKPGFFSVPRDDLDEYSKKRGHIDTSSINIVNESIRNDIRSTIPYGATIQSVYGDLVPQQQTTAVVAVPPQPQQPVPSAYNNINNNNRHRQPLPPVHQPLQQQQRPATTSFAHQTPPSSQQQQQRPAATTTMMLLQDETSRRDNLKKRKVADILKNNVDKYRDNVRRNLTTTSQNILLRSSTSISTTSLNNDDERANDSFGTGLRSPPPSHNNNNNQQQAQPQHQQPSRNRTTKSFDNIPNDSSNNSNAFSLSYSNSVSHNQQQQPNIDVDDFNDNDVLDEGYWNGPPPPQASEGDNVMDDLYPPKKKKHSAGRGNSSNFHIH